MNIKKLLMGAITGGIVFFLLGWLIYDKLLADFMRHNPGEIGLIGRKEIKFIYLAAGQLVYGLFLTWILLKANVKSMMGGLTTGAATGLLMAAAIDLTMYGTSVVISKKGMAADIAASLVIAAIAGAVIGLVISGRKSNNT